MSLRLTFPRKHEIDKNIGEEKSPDSIQNGNFQMTFKIAHTEIMISNM